MKNLVLVIIAVVAAFASSARSLEPFVGFDKQDNTSVIKKWLQEDHRKYCASDTTSVWRQRYSPRLSGGSRHADFFNREMVVECRGKKKFLVQCTYRGKNIQGKLDISATLIDETGNVLEQADVPVMPKSIGDWQLASAQFYCVSNARLKISGKLSGKGEVWIDDILVKEFQ